MFALYQVNNGKEERVSWHMSEAAAKTAQRKNEKMDRELAAKYQSYARVSEFRLYLVKKAY